MRFLVLNTLKLNRLNSFIKVQQCNASNGKRTLFIATTFFIVSRRMVSNTPCSCSRRTVYRDRRPRRRPSNSRNSSRRRNAIRRRQFHSCDTCWRNPTNSPHRWRPGHRKTAAPEGVPYSVPSLINYSPCVLWT